MGAKSNKLEHGRRLSLSGDTSLFQRSTLENGITVLSEKIPFVRSVSLGFWVTTGSRDEDPDKNGISHLIEHMLFKGTSTRSAYDIALEIERVGGVLNAFTGKELTCYYAHVLDENLPLAVTLLSDMLTASLFTPEDIVKEQHVILEEISDANEIPEDRIQECFYRDLFADHPLARPVMGVESTVMGLTRDDLVQYMSETYCPDRIFVAAAGNVEHKDLCELIEQHFRLQTRPGHHRELSTPAPAKAATREYTMPTQLGHVCIGARGLAFSDPNRYSVLILNTLLGGGMSSRLFQSVREQHALCYNIYSFIDAFIDTGVFCVYTATDPAKLQHALDVIRSEFDALRRNGISAAELAATKSQLKGSLMLGLEDTSSRMNRIAKMEIYLQQYYSLDDVIAGIDAVKPDDVNALASELLDPNGLVTSMMRSEQTL